MLLVIAVFPLWIPHWWERNRNKLVVAAVLGVPVLGPIPLPAAPTRSLHMGADYVSFIILLAGLFVISGGVLLRGDLVATPPVNTAFLAVGRPARLGGGHHRRLHAADPPPAPDQPRAASVPSTPWSSSSSWCRTSGGMLTPLGDPPLFLGYLAGRALHLDAPAVAPLAAHDRAPARHVLRLGLGGLRAASRSAPSGATARRSSRSASGAGSTPCGSSGWWLAVALLHAPLREAAIVALAALSLWRTPARDPPRQRLHRGPDGGGGRALLRDLPDHDPRARAAADARGRARACGRPGSSSGRRGSLSSFLDNAPTYLTFLALAQGLGLPARGGGGAARDPRRHQRGRGGDGGEQLHRQRPQLHGQGHRRGSRREDAELRRLHGSTAARC